MTEHKPANAYELGYQIGYEDANKPSHEKRVRSYDDAMRICTEAGFHARDTEELLNGEFVGWQMGRTRTCGTCGSEAPQSDYDWVNDRYGIPYAYCCSKCRKDVRKKIARWRFDRADAGDALEPEDYTN